jgi:3-methyladenine DNA glycosylase AlkD
MQKVTSSVISALKKNSDKKTREISQRFFKEPVLCRGVKAAVVTRISKEHYKKISGNEKEKIFGYCEELFKTGYCEDSWIASNWAYARRREFKPEDFKLFERWVNQYVSNWASCDTFCNHTMGEFLEMYPRYIGTLIKKWARSKNRWVRRAAAVSLIVPAKNGKFLKDAFKISDKMLIDKDDMVLKGYGWLLKEASRKHQKEVFDFVVKRKSKMPRTAYRYAIEKMSPGLKKQAMAK